MHCLASLAPVTALLGERERGLHLAEEAVAIAHSFPFASVVNMALTGSCETAILSRAPRLATEALNQLLENLRDQSSRRWLGDALEMAALVLDGQHHVSEATDLLRAARSIRTESGERLGGTRALAATVLNAYDHLLRAAGPDRPDTGTGPRAVDAVIDLALASLDSSATGSPRLGFDGPDGTSAETR